MDVIVLSNGLGNQMSQYAFYLQKKSYNNSTYFISFCNDHNGLELDKVFKIKTKESVIQKILYLFFRILLTEKFNFFSGLINNYFNCKIVKENFNYNFNIKYLEPSKSLTFYYGGWHTEKYFINVEKIIRENYLFKNQIGVLNEQYLEDIINLNSVSLHVRRGDFMNEKNIGLFGGVASKEFYLKAIEIINNHIENPHFFVFSNDMQWAKENLGLKNVTFVNCNFGPDSWKDMYLMSKCKNNIIPNSTFSWWAAWLNENPKKSVICPSKFLINDIISEVYVENWIKISQL
jgi:hypothetical protein